MKSKMKANSQRAKAAAMLEPEIMALGQSAQRTRTAPGPVAQNNMSAQGSAQAPGLPTASAMPFRRGGSVPRSKAGRMSAGGPTMDAGERAGKAEGRGGRPTAADERTENADKMKRGGRYAPGGKVTDSEGNAMVGQDRIQPVSYPKSGLLSTRDLSELQPKNTYTDTAAEQQRGASQYAKGGAVCKACGGKMSSGGKCMKCGGRAMAKGGHVDEAQDKKLFKRMFKTEESKETKGFAMGGPAKIRRGVALPSGEPNKAKGKQVGNAYSGNKGLI